MNIRRQRKGFTVLELIIAISVFSVLASILVPTFTNLSKSNKYRADEANVRNLNNTLALEEQKDEYVPSKTLGDVLTVLAKHSYDETTLAPRSDKKILWNEETNRFLLEDKKANDKDPSIYWTIIKEYDPNNQPYSMYASEELNVGTIDNLHMSFDIGNNDHVSRINYVNSGEGKTTKLVTRSNVDLYINAPQDTIYHYGDANTVNIDAVSDNSYHLYNDIKELAISQGRVVLEKESHLDRLFVDDSNKVVVASTLKSKLTNFQIFNSEIVRCQIVSHNTGNVFVDTYAYVNKTHDIILEDKLTGEEIDENTGETDIIIKQLKDADRLALNYRDHLNTSFTLSGEIEVNDNTYTVSGTVAAYINEYQDLAYDIDFTLGLDFTNVNFKITYIGGTHYIQYNDHVYSFSSADIEEIFNFINSFEGEIKLPASLFGVTSRLFKNKFEHMTSVRTDEEIVYTCNLSNELAPVIITSDFEYNLTSIKIDDLKDDDFNVSLLLEVNALSSGSSLIKLPEYQNIETYHFASLEQAKKDGLFDQFNNFINLKKLAIGYDLTVTREEGDDLTFTTEGNLDLNLRDEFGQEDIKVRINGNLINKDADLPLNSNFDITYLNENLYFTYNNTLKLKYSKVGIEEIIDIFGRYQDTEFFQKLSDKFFPNGSSTASAFFEAIKESNYMKMLVYFDSFSKSGNDIILNFKPGILGLDEEDGLISIKVTLSSKGIAMAQILNLRAFGYRIEGTFTFKDYTTITVPANSNQYTPLDYANGLFEELFSVTQQHRFAYNLNASIVKQDNDGDKTTTINAYTQFELGTSSDYGVAYASIVDSKNKTHNVSIDVIREKTDSPLESEKDAAFERSQVYFKYNDGLQGRLSVGSLLDFYDVLHGLSNDGNKRFEKYKNYLIADISRSTIIRLLQDEVEAILYNDMFSNITYNANKKTYSIQINGNFLKNNDTYNIDYIYIDVAMNNDGTFKTLNIRANNLLATSTFKGYNVSLTFSKRNWTNPIRLSHNNSDYIDFTDLRTLSTYFLNTAKKDYFTISGNLDIDLAWFNNTSLSTNLKDIPMEARGYIQTVNGEEKVYVQVAIDIPYIGWGQNKTGLTDKWDSRKLYITFTDKDVYLKVDTYYENETHVNYVHTKTVLGVKWYDKHEWKQDDHYVKEMKLTMKDFFSNALYYIGNFGFDLKDSLNGVSGINENMDYSKIVTSFLFNNNKTNPSWTTKINLKEMTGKSDFTKDATLTLSGSNNQLSTLYGNVYVKTNFLLGIDATLNASLSTATYSSSIYNNIISYVSSCSSRNYGQKYTSKYGENKRKEKVYHLLNSGSDSWDHEEVLQNY